MKGIDETAAWSALRTHGEELRGVPIVRLFETDPQRFQRFSLELDGLLLDYSKQRLNAHTLDLLVELARTAGLEAWRERLFAGEPINHTEQRAALHMALRGNAGTGGEQREAAAALARLQELVDAIRSGKHRGFSGESITDVIHVGIGGSDLGPRLVLRALARHADGPRIHFVSNIDGVELSACLETLNPARTLVSIASKSFGTRETLLNGEVARDWLIAAAGSAEAAQRQLVALTGAEAKARDFGIVPELIFPVWGWVGGRYSVWSSVGFPIAVACGMATFREFLAGAAAMDEHFQRAPLAENMPVVLALVGVWCNNFLGMNSLAVVPYTERLAYLPAYLQQLEMESNGKAVDREGRPVRYQTVPVLWGQTGTVGQHAFFQALHQGTCTVAADFIGIVRPDTPLTEHHLQLVANLFAQTEALMRGQGPEEARAQMQAQGLSPERIEALLPFRVFAGDRPSNTILLREMSPRLLGMLIALYEHKVFCQSVIWNLNPFDQWGVELGKRLADDLLPALASGEGLERHDGSTQGLVKQYHRWLDDR